MAMAQLSAEQIQGLIEAAARAADAASRAAEEMKKMSDGQNATDLVVLQKPRRLSDSQTLLAVLAQMHLIRNLQFGLTSF